MAGPTKPTYDDLSGPFDGLYFDADEPRWYPREVHGPTLVAELAALPGLEPFEDDLGNLQSAVRLDGDPQGATGVWVTVPKGTAWPAIDAVVAAHDATPAPEPVPPVEPTPGAKLIAELAKLNPLTATTADVVKAAKAAQALQQGKKK
jgi:hypothetical protein